MKVAAGQGEKGKKGKMRAKLSVEDMIKLRASTFLAEKTIRSWARGDNVFTSTARKLEDAASELGIEVIA